MLIFSTVWTYFGVLQSVTTETEVDANSLQMFAAALPQTAYGLIVAEIVYVSH